MGELLRDKGIWAAAAVCLASFVLGLPFELVKPPLKAGAFLELYGKALESQIVLFCIPIVSVLPVGAVFVRESQGGFIRLYISRISRMEYIRRRVSLVYWGGVLPFFLSGSLFLAGCFLFFYPLELVGEISWNAVFDALRLLGRICLVGGIFAEVSGIFAAVFRNYYMAYGLPFVCYYLLVIVKERYLPGMYALYPGEWMAVEGYWGADGSGIWWLLLAVTAALAAGHGLCLYGRLWEL